MHAIPVASAALMGAAALALTLPTAAADTADGAGGSVRKQPFSFAVTPSTVAPGGMVTLGVSGCSTTATASSGVFDTVTIPPRQTATARVDLDARRGAVYSVQFTCNNQTGTTDLTISGGGAATPTTRSTSTAAPRPQPQGVKGGLGGSIGGMNAVEIAAGVVLVLAASGGVVYVVRRRSGSRLH